MNAGKRIKALMAAEGISQTALSERLGIKPSSVSRLLSDKSNPTVSKLEEVYGALGFDFIMSCRKKNDGFQYSTGDDLFDVFGRPERK